MEYVVLFVILLCLSAFFSSSETAYLSLQRLKLTHYIQEGRPHGRRANIGGKDDLRHVSSFPRQHWLRLACRLVVADALPPEETAA